MSKSYAIGIDVDGKKYRFEMNRNCSMLCGDKDLKSLTIFDEDNKLRHLYCHRNELKELTIIDGQNILEIWCEKNNLSSLDLSMCSNLEELDCDFELENNIILQDNHKLNEIIFYY